MRVFEKKRSVILILTAVCLAAVFVFTYRKTQNEDVEQKRLAGGDLIVIFDSKGFTPSELVVSVGSVVVFQNNSTASFWPASDMHPTHDIYPEFDPKKPVGSKQSWNFQFNRAGEWKYHDHLNPTLTGTIAVKDTDGAVTTIDCADNSKDSGCWLKEINQILVDSGLDAALERLSELYSTEPVFAQSCHAFAHELGKAAYRQFSQNGNVELSDKTKYCGYGFYHGFMETLLYTSGDVRQAQDFCAYVGKQLQSQTVDAEGACFHGIGHGAVDGSDERSWGNAKAMLEPGEKMCRQVASEFREPYGKMYRCVTGAYNALEILSADSKYKLDELSKNPFGFCASQPQDFLEGCYTNMLPAILRITRSDYAKSAEMVRSIKADTEAVRGPVMLSLFHEYIREHLKEPDYGVVDGIKLCRAREDLSIWCIEGLSGGHMKYGKPREEYVQGLKFCASPLLTKLERARCYNHILPRLRIWYSQEKAKAVCLDVPEPYRYLCSTD